MRKRRGKGEEASVEVEAGRRRQKREEAERRRWEEEMRRRGAQVGRGQRAVARKNRAARPSKIPVG